MDRVNGCHGHKEKGIRNKIAEQLGYDNPKELGEAMKGNSELREKVHELREKLGGHRKHNHHHHRHHCGKGKDGPDKTQDSSKAQTNDADSDKDDIEDIEDTSSMQQTNAADSTSKDPQLAELALQNGYIDTKGKGDVDALIAAVKNHTIKDPNIVSQISPEDLLKIDKGDMNGMDDLDWFTQMSMPDDPSDLARRTSLLGIS